MKREKIDHKKLKIHDPVLCKECALGACCRYGVEVDLFEVARILTVPLEIARPWFHFLRRDKRFPSGFVFGTNLRNRRCIFQAEDRRCLVYSARPRYCREFPLEDNRRAPDYHILCHRAKSKK
ncbi:MAG: YkgJ family cysteine cluster protein [Candidatus Omnitrophota bacterium]